MNIRLRFSTAPTAPTMFRRAALVLSCVLLGQALAACQSTSSSDGGTGAIKGNVVLHDENSYTSTSSLMIPTVQTAAGVDLDICWNAISKDILCHSLAPTTDIDNVSFLKIMNFTPAEIEAKLASGGLASSQVKIYSDHHVDHTTAETCTKLSALALGQTNIDPAQDYTEGTDRNYLMLFSKGTTPGSGARTMTFIQPTAASTNTSVTAPDGCGILSFTADLTTPTPLAIPVAGPWVLDWSQITQDSMGGTVLFQNLNRLLLAFYQGMTVTDLQTHFFDIETLATSLYDYSIPQGTKYADLAKAKDSNGTAFSGFDRVDGVWAVGLLCSTCQVPAPVALAVLAPQ